MITAQDIADVLNAQGIGKAQFGVMMQMFGAQVKVAQARGALAAAQAAQEKTAQQASETVHAAQNALIDAEDKLRAQVEAVA